MARVEFESEPDDWEEIELRIVWQEGVENAGWQAMQEGELAGNWTWFSAREGMGRMKRVVVRRSVTSMVVGHVRR